MHDLPPAREERQNGAVGKSSQHGASTEQTMMKDSGTDRMGETLQTPAPKAAQSSSAHRVLLEICPTPGSPLDPNLCKSHTQYRLTQPRQGAVVTEI